MAYGGLRGAVSFSLVEMLMPNIIHPRQMFVTTTLAVILFTVFVQVIPSLQFYCKLLSLQLCDCRLCIKGATIKLFVRLLHIQKDSKTVKHLMDEMNETVSSLPSN